MELLDVYDNNGNRTGRVVERGNKNEVFSDNEHIAVAIIFIENSKGEFLIQKTSKENKEYSSTGGHIDHNEDADSTIIREVKEELGVDITIDEVVKLGYRLFDFPLRFLYYLKKDIDVSKIKIQESEVEFVKYMSVEEIKDIIAKGQMNKGHAMLFNEILKYKES
ncbi:MAG: NUDIX domain-containing protein [Bacilli bacterium]|nr:NUDIX domain-containing protein [Bacilli bacterium]